MSSDKHIFAIYFKDLSTHIGVQSIYDETVLHRIKSILRLKEGETLILFNGHDVAVASIEATANKLVRVSIIEIKDTIPLKPDIIWLLPILEREAFEQALQFLAAIGITSIQPIITEKSRHAWGSVKDYERAHKIMVAGCEQAKQFVIPHLLPVQKFNSFAWQSLPQSRLFFDPKGQPFFNVLHEMQQPTFCCFVGPEGDLTVQEKEILRQHQFQSCALTPTILKAVDAITVVAGIMRIYF